MFVGCCNGQNDSCGLKAHQWLLRSQRLNCSKRLFIVWGRGSPKRAPRYNAQQLSQRVCVAATTAVNVKRAPVEAALCDAKYAAHSNKAAAKTKLANLGSTRIYLYVCTSCIVKAVKTPQKPLPKASPLFAQPSLCFTMQPFRRYSPVRFLR